MKPKHLLLLLLLVCIQLTVYSQKQNIAGLNLTAEASDGFLLAGAGLTFERKLTKHSGLETGLYLRTYKMGGIVMTEDYFFHVSIAEKYVSLPVLYKFYSRIVNFSIGPTIDFYVGWRQTSGKAVIKLKEYEIEPKMTVGAMLKISKSINLTKAILLEPEIRANPVLTTNYGYLGLGIAAKYRLEYLK